MFSVVPELEARERTLKAELAKKAKTQISRAWRGKSAEDVRRDWDEAAGDTGVRRAILSWYLKAVVIRRSARRGIGISTIRLSSRYGRTAPSQTSTAPST
jgi:hypothetical protein